jgi:hypothetical protein
MYAPTACRSRVQNFLCPSTIREERREKLNNMEASQSGFDVYQFLGSTWWWSPFPQSLSNELSFDKANEYIDKYNDLVHLESIFQRIFPSLPQFNDWDEFEQFTFQLLDSLLFSLYIQHEYISTSEEGDPILSNGQLQRSAIRADDKLSLGYSSSSSGVYEFELYALLLQKLFEKDLRRITHENKITYLLSYIVLMMEQKLYKIEHKENHEQDAFQKPSYVYDITEEQSSPLLLSFYLLAQYGKRESHHSPLPNTVKQYLDPLWEACRLIYQHFKELSSGHLEYHFYGKNNNMDSRSYHFLNAFTYFSSEPFVETNSFLCRVIEYLDIFLYPLQTRDDDPQNEYKIMEERNGTIYMNLLADMITGPTVPTIYSSSNQRLQVTDMSNVYRMRIVNGLRSIAMNLTAFIESISSASSSSFLSHTPAFEEPGLPPYQKRHIPSSVTRGKQPRRNSMDNFTGNFLSAPSKRRKEAKGIEEDMDML